MFSCEPIAAHATRHRAAHEVLLAVARLHAVVSIEAFSTNLGASGAHPARLAPAFAVAGPTEASILTGAFLGAVESICPIGAGCGAIITLPTGHAKAGTRHRVAFAAILAPAFLSTVVTPPIHWARLAAPQAHVAGTTLTLASDVVAGVAIAVHALDTHLRAVLAKGAGRAWFAAVLAHPPSFTDADASLGIA